MRILVNGQQAFGKAVLERLLATDDEVVGVYCGPDRDGSSGDRDRLRPVVAERAGAQ